MATRSKRQKLSTKFILYVIIPVAIMGILMAFAEQRIFENRFENFARAQFIGRDFYGVSPYFSEQRLKNINNVKRMTMVEIVVSFVFAFGTSLAISIILAEIFQSKISQSLKELSNAIEIIQSNEKIDFSNVAFSSEISDLAKKIEILSEKLSERSMARKAMTSSVYHEVMTPLGVVKMELEALKDDVIPYEKPLVDKMLISVDHISEVLKDLKNIEGDELAYSRENFDAGEETEKIFKSFIAVFESRNITFKTQFENVQINADKRRFKQVIFNLLSNAAKYTSQGGVIKIKTRKAGIEISNTFKGKSPEKLDYGTGLRFVNNFCEYHRFEFSIKKVDENVVASIEFKG
ncbi:MAG: HAMP domain-containing histidine kinase [Thermotogae bacterium]|nr:HAMP domain-containing histidine kinase [Thermotogota bacterium]